MSDKIKTLIRGHTYQFPTQNTARSSLKKEVIKSSKNQSHLISAEIKMRQNRNIWYKFIWLFMLPQSTFKCIGNTKKCKVPREYNIVIFQCRTDCGSRVAVVVPRQCQVSRADGGWRRENYRSYCCTTNDTFESIYHIISSFVQIRLPCSSFVQSSYSSKYYTVLVLWSFLTLSLSLSIGQYLFALTYTSFCQLPSGFTCQISVQNHTSRPSQ